MDGLQLDHLVITAYRLETGIDYVEDLLGVRMQAGGIHTSMGTHNALLKLGKRQYLEVIAPDPGLPKPKRTRWFALDMIKPTSIPRLVTWVVRTADIRSSMHSLKELTTQIVSMSRGDYEWLISIPPDGSLPYQGILPSLIEWQHGHHPADKLPESGCKLIRLEAYHQQPEKILPVFESAGIQEIISILGLDKDEAPYLEAYIETPGGLKKLSSKSA